MSPVRASVGREQRRPRRRLRLSTTTTTTTNKQNGPPLEPLTNRREWAADHGCRAALAQRDRLRALGAPGLRVHLARPIVQSVVSANSETARLPGRLTEPPQGAGRILRHRSRLAGTALACRLARCTGFWCCRLDLSGASRAERTSCSLAAVTPDTFVWPMPARAESHAASQRPPRHHRNG